MRKNDAFDAKTVNTRLTKIFIAIFVPDVRLPSSATLATVQPKVGIANSRGPWDVLQYLGLEITS